MVKVVTSLEEFEECQKKSDNSVFLLDFYADWCGPCRMLTPVLERLSEKFKDNVTVLKIDVDQASDLCSIHKISCMPTIVFMINDKILDELRVEGCREDEIVKNLNKCLELAKKNNDTPPPPPPDPENTQNIESTESTENKKNTENTENTVNSENKVTE